MYSFENEFNNIGSDEPITIKDAANLVLKIGKEFKFNKSKLTFLEKRKEVVHAFCDHAKAQRDLGFKDESNLENLIRDMFNYYLKIDKKQIKDMTYEINKNMYSFWK